MPLFMSTLLPKIVLAWLACLKIHSVLAQITSNATCLPAFSLFDNSRQQSPCLVAAYLAAQCNGGQFDVSALGPENFYAGPSGVEANKCQCNTVYYNLISACGYCQNSTFVSWASWSADCSQVNVASFPAAIPANTSVPGWAFENTTMSGFDPQAAIADHSPESSAPPSASTIRESGTTLNSMPNPTQTTPAPSLAKGDGASAKAGIAIGASIGGFTLISAVVWFIWLRSRRQWHHRYGHVRILADGEADSKAEQQQQPERMQRAKSAMRQVRFAAEAENQSRRDGHGREREREVDLQQGQQERGRTMDRSARRAKARQSAIVMQSPLAFFTPVAPISPSPSPRLSILTLGTIHTYALVNTDSIHSAYTPYTGVPEPQSS